MRVHWKFPLCPASTIEISAPLLDLSTCTVGISKGVICLWGTVEDTYQNPIKWAVALLGTGWDAGAFVCKYPHFVGTVIQDPYVWHCYIVPALK